LSFKRGNTADRVIPASAREDVFSQRAGEEQAAGDQQQRPQFIEELTYQLMPSRVGRTLLVLCKPHAREIDLDGMTQILNFKGFVE
jgi:hypothetical protein